jgi:hypothetical protein
MNIQFQRISVPEDFDNSFLEVINGVPVIDIPKGWSGIMIFHPATKQYFCTKSVNPLQYEEIVRLKKEPRWSSIAVALNKMLDHHPDFQFFVLHTRARPIVEKWMAFQGYSRIATKMGEGTSEPSTLFKVYSPANKITRYVVAPHESSHSKLLKQANSSFAAWLASGTWVNRQERVTMRAATQSNGYKTNAKVFEKESVVTRTDLLNGLKDNEFRAVCTKFNLQAAREFIQATVRG